MILLMMGVYAYMLRNAGERRVMAYGIFQVVETLRAYVAHTYTFQQHKVYILISYKCSPFALTA